MTKKEERFCAEYIIDFNGTKAAIRAGYGQNPKNDGAKQEKAAANAACRLMKNDEIRSRVRELNLEYIEKNCFLEKNRIIKEIWETYKKASAAEPVLSWDYSEHKYVESGEWQFDGKTAGKCLELLGKTIGMFEDKIEHKFDPVRDGVSFSLTVQGGDKDA